MMNLELFGMFIKLLFIKFNFVRHKAKYEEMGMGRVFACQSALEISIQNLTRLRTLSFEHGMIFLISVAEMDRSIFNSNLICRFTLLSI